jgi:hypothetical protein
MGFWAECKEDVRAEQRNLLKIKEKAAVGIEPTNKGFADLFSHVLQSVMECHGRVNIGFLQSGEHSITLHACRYYPQKSPQ